MAGSRKRGLRKIAFGDVFFRYEARGWTTHWAIPLAECRALAALYETTDGPNWTDNSGWFTDPCVWHGITCQEESVTALQLAENGLSGPIPPELGNLTNLTWLSLCANQLSSNIPSELGNLANLTRLYLGYNQLSGLLPLSLMNLSLTEFSYSASSLCLPDDPDFQSWLANIEDLSATEITCQLEPIASGQNSGYTIYLPLIR